MYYFKYVKKIKNFNAYNNENHNKKLKFQGIGKGKKKCIKNKILKLYCDINFIKNNQIITIIVLFCFIFKIDIFIKIITNSLNRTRYNFNFTNII